MTYIEKLWKEYGEYDDEGAYFISYDFFELAVKKAMQAQREACADKAIYKIKEMLAYGCSMNDNDTTWIKAAILNAEVSSD